jgi:hypothetical protein
MRWSMLKLHLEAAQTYAQVCFGGRILRRRKCFSVKVASDFSEGGSLSGFGFLC